MIINGNAVASVCTSTALSEHQFSVFFILPLGTHLLWVDTYTHKLCALHSFCLNRLLSQEMRVQFLLKQAYR